MAGQDDDEHRPGPGSRASPWRFLPLVLLALAAAGALAGGAHRYLSLEQLLASRDALQGFVSGHLVQALLAYAGIYVTAVALSVPGAVFLTIAGGFLFGWPLGGAAAAVSATVGAVCVFAIARTSVGDLLLRRAGPRLKGLADGFRDDAFAYLLFLRFLPVVPFWLTNLAAALFAVPLKTFAVATAIGILPATAAFAVAGAGLDSLVEAQRAARDACLAAGGTGCGLDLGLRSVLTPKLLAAFAALGAASLLPVAAKRLAGRRLKRPEEQA